MSADLLNSWAAVISALAWPITILVVVLLLRGVIRPAIAQGGAVHFRVKEWAEFTVEPAVGLRPPSAGAERSSQLTTTVPEIPKNKQQVLPFDYCFLNHTSFLRKDKQEEFRNRTGVPLDIMTFE